MNFNKWLLASCLVLGLQTSGFAQKTFEYQISGKIPGAEKILLSSDPMGGSILDSVQNADGSFVFKGTAKSISLGSILVESKKTMFAQHFNVFIEPGVIKVKTYEGGRQIEAKGSPNNDIMTLVESNNKEFWLKVSKMYDTLNYASMRMHELRKAEVVNKDSITHYQSVQNKIEEASTPLINTRNERLKVAFRKYPKSYFTAYTALNSYLSEEELRDIYAGFDETMKSSAVGKEWKERLFNVKRLVEGVQAPDFAVTDVNGKQVKLSDQKGKYVLLDFWATWCGPCRAGNPHLISLYTKYKDQGLEFIGVSDDDKNVVGWKKAINDDGIGIWPQVLRNRDKKNPEGESLDIAGLYDVKSYPTKILIDRDGKVVRVFADDNEMDELFKEIFKKP